MTFDDIYNHIGGIGAFQISLYLLLGLPSFFGGYQSIAMTFLGPDQDHWCEIERLHNFSHEQQKYIAIPFNEEENMYERCVYYDLPYNDFTDEEFWNWNWSVINQYHNISEIECQSWVYDQSEFVVTAVSEYNLVCGDTYKVSLVYSSYLAAITITTFISGPLSDYFGRTLLLKLSCIQIIFGLAAAFAQDYALFITLRFLMTIGLCFGSSGGLVLSMEIFGPKHRTIPGGLYWTFWAIGFMTLPVISYFIRDFRTLQIVLASPMLSSLTYLFLVPESPRWLSTQKRYKEANDILMDIAEINNKCLPQNSIDILKNGTLETNDNDIENNNVDKETITNDGVTNKNTVTLKDIFRTPILCRQLALLIPAWMSCSLLYYGLSFNTGTLAGNVYVNTFLSGFVEIPANLFALFLLFKSGRKYSQAGSLFIAGTACLACIPLLEIEQDYAGNIITGLTLIGKASVTISYTVVFVYTAELFPTPLRQIAIGTCNMTANFVGLIAPFTGPPMINIWKPLPLVIFGVVGTISGFCVLFLHETKDQKLPDTVEHVNVIRSSQSKATKNSININISNRNRDNQSYNTGRYIARTDTVNFS